MSRGCIVLLQAVLAELCCLLYTSKALRKAAASSMLTACRIDAGSEGIGIIKTFQTLGGMCSGDRDPPRRTVGLHQPLKPLQVLRTLGQVRTTWTLQLLVKCKNCSCTNDLGHLQRWGVDEKREVQWRQFSNSAHWCVIALYACTIIVEVVFDLRLPLVTLHSSQVGFSDLALAMMRTALLLLAVLIGQSERSSTLLHRSPLPLCRAELPLHPTARLPPTDSRDPSCLHAGVAVKTPPTQLTACKRAVTKLGLSLKGATIFCPTDGVSGVPTCCFRTACGTR
jgi:hypothetical protein